MRGMIIILFLLMLPAVVLTGQDHNVADAVLNLVGLEDPEDIDAYEAERLADYLEHPLKINLEPLSRLVSSGLMSRYQAAALCDYRSRHGDVLSIGELSAIDGFGEAFASSLAPFISLYSDNMPGAGSAKEFRMENDLALRGSMKISGTEGISAPVWDYGVKYRCMAGDNLSVALAVSKDAFTGTVAYRFRKLPLRLAAGDFNARFGQGLALWNGMTMSGISSPSSFIKSQSSISESWSFKGSSVLTGLAAEIDKGKFTISALAALPGIKDMKSVRDGISVMPAVNCSWYGRVLHLGLTHYVRFDGILSEKGAMIPDMKSSCDISMCLRGTDVFAEVAMDWVNARLSALSGLVFPVGDVMRLGTILRFYPQGYSSSYSGAVRSGSGCENEYAVTVAGQYMSQTRRNNGVLSFDAAYFPLSKDKSGLESVQLKGNLSWESKINDAIVVKARLSERIRTWGLRFRTDFRTEVKWTAGRFYLGARANILHCTDLALLGYMDLGYAHKGFNNCFRAGLFKVDDWDDRIYVYERDAPGNFNVPAFYGRGTWFSYTASWKFARWGRLYFRASMTSYPFMAEKKPGRAELKLQGVFSF